MPWQSGDRLFRFSPRRCEHQCRGSVADHALITRTVAAWPPHHTALGDCTLCSCQNASDASVSHLILQFPTIAILYLCFLSIVSAR
jgi:hypothetical protein